MIEYKEDLWSRIIIFLIQKRLRYLRKGGRLRGLTIQTQAFEGLEQVVKSRGTSGGVYLPISWTGKRVKVLLLDPVENEK